MHIPHYNIVLDPKDLTLNDAFNFRCYKGIVCFNKCCYDVKLILTPYDFLRLRTYLGMSTEEFVEKYAEVYIGEVTQLPTVSVNMLPIDYACPFLDKEEGCKVYPARPSSCRFYPLVRYFAVSENGERVEVFKIWRETHCKGHYENRPITVQNYLEEQGLIPNYIYFNDLWGEIVSQRQKIKDIPLTGDLLEEIFLLAYDLDTLKEVIKEDEHPAFNKEDIELPAEKLLEKGLIYIRDELLKEENFRF
jgi:Fe-S-cluster containining protein